MPYGDYLTPSHAGVYIGHVLIDDCYDVRWGLQDSSSPIFGYSHPLYQAISPGKVLVSGSLAINFRFPGYLARAISEAQKLEPGPSSSPKEREQTQKLIEFAREMTRGTRSDRIRLMAKAMREGMEFADKFAGISAILMQSTQELNEQEVSYLLPGMLQRIDPTAPPSTIDIWVHYGDEDETFVADKLDGVLFLGQNKTLTAGASPAGGISSSGSPIFEIYPFVARQVTQWKKSSKRWVQEPPR